VFCHTATKYWSSHGQAFYLEGVELTPCPTYALPAGIVDTGSYSLHFDARKIISKYYAAVGSR